MTHRHDHLMPRALGAMHLDTGGKAHGACEICECAGARKRIEGRPDGKTPGNKAGNNVACPSRAIFGF
jgi:hypothetical protein